MSATEIKDFSMTDLIETNPRFLGLKQKLSVFRKGSDEYFRELFTELPLSSWPNYKTYLKSQAIPVPESKRTGYSPIYRSSMSPDQLVTCVDRKKLATFYDHFKLSTRLWPDNDCLGHRPFNPFTETWDEYFEFESYAQVEKRSRHIGAGILSVVNGKRGKPISTNDFIVAILSHNRPEWVLTDLACQAYSLTSTALYETLGIETSEYIMDLTESPILLFAKSNLYKIINILPDLKHINTLVCFEDLNEEELKLLNDSVLPVNENSKNEKIQIYSLRQLEQIGALTEIPVIPPTPDSIYTISFTSGTTGVPKGVEMSHRNVASGIAFSLSSFKLPSHKKGKQLHDLCFLPLAHIFQREIMSYEITMGAGMGFLHKPDPNILVEDLKILKPDTVSLVPRILTKFEAGIKNALEKSAFQKTVANNIIDTKQARFITKGGPDRSVMNSLLYHRVLIDKIRDSLGLTNTAFMITGSAPISTETLLFLRSALDIGLRQGYGMTETFAGICLSEPYEKDPGTCGAIGIAAECRLKSVPAMGYHAENDLKGELQVRGPQVFEKYFKKPNETAQSFDEEGWFSTGDVGFIDSKGRLRVIDRVKNFFKLAQGEYVAPEKIENMYLSTCPYLSQIFIYGDSLKTYLVGIIGIDVESVQTALSAKHHHVKSWSGDQLVENLNRDPRLRSELVMLLNKSCKGLQGFEKLHNVHVGLEPLTVEDDVITPTLKIKRAKATVRFKDVLNGLYDEGSLIKKGRF